MSSLGALGRRKGLKRGVLYVFCVPLSAAFWSSQFPTSDNSARPLDGVCFSFFPLWFWGRWKEKAVKFHLRSIIKPGEAAAGRWVRYHSIASPGRADLGRVFCISINTCLDYNTRVQLRPILSKIGTSSTGIMKFFICKDTPALWNM